MNNFVDVEFYRPISVGKVSDNIGNDQLRPNSAEYDRIILEYLQENRRITRKEAKVILELGETKIKELFNELIDRGLIQRVGAGRGTYYVLEMK